MPEGVAPEGHRPEGAGKDAYMIVGAGPSANRREGARDACTCTCELVRKSTDSRGLV